MPEAIVTTNYESTFSMHGNSGDSLQKDSSVTWNVIKLKNNLSNSNASPTTTHVQVLPDTPSTQPWNTQVISYMSIFN